MKRATKKDFLYTGSFHEAVGSVLALAQLFAVMPVVGIKSDRASELAFKWTSIRTIYGIIMLLLLIGYAGLGFNFMYKLNMDFDAISMIFIDNIG